MGKAFENIRISHHTQKRKASQNEKKKWTRDLSNQLKNFYLIIVNRPISIYIIKSNKKKHKKKKRESYLLVGLNLKKKNFPQTDVYVCRKSFRASDYSERIRTKVLNNNL